MAIRPATNDDAEGVGALVERAYRHWVPRIGLRPAPMDADYSALIEAGDVFVLVDPDIVGVLVLRPADGGALMVENVAIDPPRQGEGLGPSLLDFAEEQARDRGLGELRLFTHEHMAENIELYGRLGWEEYDRTVGDGFARAHFRKAVTARPAGD